MDTISNGKNLSHQKLLKQIKMFYLRVQIVQQTRPADVYTRLASHINLLQETSSNQQDEQLLQFSQTLQRDPELCGCFLIQFFKYVQSALDLEDALNTLNEIINYLLPCIGVALKSQPKEETFKQILQSDLSLNLYKCITETFKRESLYQESSITDILKYQTNINRRVKAQVVRMTPGDSKKVFQKTFGNSDNLASLYLIYIWQIHNIYEIKGGGTIHTSIHDLTQVMEKSGKYVSVVPDEEMKKMSLTDPLSPAGRYSKILIQSDKIDARHPIPDLNFEWTDFRIDSVHPNGVAFLINSASWQDDVKKISSTIEGLEVKRFLRRSPALGTTFALPMKTIVNPGSSVDGVSFIRVRVVRVVRYGCCVLGVDTGGCHQCTPTHLMLLPAAIINLPPCGRLARLPVVPSPVASSVPPALSLLTALVQHTHTTLNLSHQHVWQANLWLQVSEIHLSVLHLLKALVDLPSCDDLLPAVACVTADCLQTLIRKGQHNQEAVTLITSILTPVMYKYSKLSLRLAKRGIFPALCEAALTWKCYDVWPCIKALLGTKQSIIEFLNNYTDPPHPTTPRRHTKMIHQPCSTNTPDNLDASPTVMEMASTTPADYNTWNLEMHASLASPQLSVYQHSGKWRYDKEKLPNSHINVLRRGDHLGVTSDLTHHLLQERNVSSVCCETLLQIILGMLNTQRGGKIYIGLNQFGVVQGVKMTRDQQDCFLLGFCKIVQSDILPSVLPCDSVAHFVPVVQRKEVFPQTDLAYYVIILTVQPEPQQVYIAREHPDKLYMRDGGVNLSVQGSRYTELLEKSHVWLQELEVQVKEEKQSLLQLALNANYEH